MDSVAMLKDSEAVKFYFREALVAAQSMQGANMMMKMQAANTRLQLIGAED